MIEIFVKFTPDSLMAEFITASIADTDAVLNLLYKEIGCRSIENVCTRMHLASDLKDQIIMIVDEEGRLKDDPKANIIGCAQYRDVIVGTVIFGRVVERDGEPDFGGFASVPDAIKVAHMAQIMAVDRLHDMIERF